MIVRRPARSIGLRLRADVCAKGISLECLRGAPLCGVTPLHSAQGGIAMVRIMPFAVALLAASVASGTVLAQGTGGILFGDRGRTNVVVQGGPSGSLLFGRDGEFRGAVRRFGGVALLYGADRRLDAVVRPAPSGYVVHDRRERTTSLVTPSPSGFVIVDRDGIAGGVRSLPRDVRGGAGFFAYGAGSLADGAGFSRSGAGFD